MLGPRLSASAARDHRAISRSFELSQRVVRSLQQPPRGKQPAAFQRTLDLFRCTATGSRFSFLDNMNMNMNKSTHMALSESAVVVALDTGGGAHEVSDVGFCIYDRARRAVYTVQVDIVGRPLAKKSSVAHNLLATPMKLTAAQCSAFVARLFCHLEERAALGCDVCLVGHNLERDLKSLHRLNVRVPRAVEKVDTDILSRWCAAGRGSNLRKLAMALGVEEIKPFHPSINDAYYTLQVLLRLMHGTHLHDLSIAELKMAHEVYKENLHRNLELDVAVIKIRALVTEITGFTDPKVLDNVVKFMCNGSKRPRNFNFNTLVPRIHSAIDKINKKDPLLFSTMLAMKGVPTVA